MTTSVLVVLPLEIVTSGRALHAITFGTGDYPVPGGALLSELQLSGASFVLLTRVAPIAASLVLSWWVGAPSGPRRARPVTLIAVVAVSLSLRLVFEQLIVAYYFMALAVALVLLDVARGHLRRTTVGVVGGGGGGVLLLRGSGLQRGRLGDLSAAARPVAHRGPGAPGHPPRRPPGWGLRKLFPWLAVAACALLMWAGHVDTTDHRLTVWLWQVLLVVPGDRARGRAAPRRPTAARRPTTSR